MQSRRLRLDDQLCFALYAAANAVTRAYKPKLASIGLTYPQYLVLLVLWQDGARSVSEIGGRLKLSPNGITPLLDRLERAELITRRRDDDDRRVIHVHLTPTGSALELAAREAQQHVVCETKLDPLALAALRDTLRDLVAEMEISEPVSEESR